MFPSLLANQKILSAAFAGFALAVATPVSLGAQAGAEPSAKTPAASFSLPAIQPSAIALPLPEDRGQAALKQTLRRLGTTASVLYIVAHPDDEDGALMTYLSRGLGARVTLLSLTRGEGGQNAISGETYDALGLMRTSELLKAGEYYASSQLWGTEADFGFSKTQQEAYARWGRDRVLYDAVLAVRKVRPQIIIATFVGGVSDGHGQHQVSGEAAQEAFKLAGDPKVFPEQLKDGLQPWQPLAMYSRAPFARVTSKGIFDYATGKWAPARFHNYITGEWIDGPPSVDVTLQVGTWDPVLGRSYAQIARQGWGEQKSQNGGANPALSGPASSSYHLWGVAPNASVPATNPGKDDVGSSLFENRRIVINTSLVGLTSLVEGQPPAWLAEGLQQIDQNLTDFLSDPRNESGVEGARKLAPIYRQTLELYTRVKNSDLDAEAKAGLDLELGEKILEFQAAFKQLLGLDMLAATTVGGGERGGLGGARVGDETARSVTPGEDFRVRVHATQALGAAQLTRVWLESASGAPWKTQEPGEAIDPQAAVVDRIYHVHAADDASPTAPFNTRPSIEQPYYDISNPAWRERSFRPYPLAAWVEFTFEGLPIRIGSVVQTLQRITGIGGIYQPLVVTPNVGVRMEPAARILPLDGSALPVKVTVHATRAASGTVSLKLPEGWHASPSEAQFNLKDGVDSAPIVFLVSAVNAAGSLYNVEAVAHSSGHDFKTGWQTIGYPGIQSYDQYTAAKLDTRKVDVKLAPGLRVGYIMGPGDEVPEAIEELGVMPHLLSDAELSAGDYSAWNVIVVGIRAYSTRPVVAASQAHLDDFVRRGGTLIVQYQTEAFPAPLPLTVNRTNVVDEQAPIKLLDPANPLLSWPNKITTADFDGWVEERGHSFLDSWDPGYTALTETADQGQDPQRGGLVVTHPGRGTYIYVAYALYRQLPELVPGSYRLLANLLSAAARPQ
jgi:LmbE family N-acetylglucosaminyl deacetylase